MLILTDLQRQFEANTMTRLTRGEVLNLAPGYQEIYEAWLQEDRVKINLVKWSAHERTQEFLLYLEKVCDQRLVKWIDAQAFSEDKKNLLKHEVKRGEWVLSSRDGRHFDQGLSLRTLDPTVQWDYRILSPTLRETLTNRLEQAALLQEQASIRVARRLEEAGYFVEDIHYEEGAVQANVLRSKSQTPYHVTVDMTGEASAPLLYDFVDKEGKHTQTNEHHLGDDWGQVEDTRLEISPDFADELYVRKALNDREKKGGLLAAATAALAPQFLTPAAPIEYQKPRLEIRDAKLIQPNITASKAAVQNRMKEEKAKLQAEKDLFLERKQAAQEEEDRRQEFQEDADEDAAVKSEQSLNPTTGIAKAALAAGSAALAGGAGTALFLTTTLHSTGLV